MSETLDSYPVETSPDVDRVLDSVNGLRNWYNWINHREKEKVAATLASLKVHPALSGPDSTSGEPAELERSIPGIIANGLKYFHLSLSELAKEKAEAQERTRLTDLYKSMSHDERKERGWWSKGDISVKLAAVGYDAHELDLNVVARDTIGYDPGAFDLKEIAQHMLKRQIHDAFSVAYQGVGRLPFRPPIDEPVSETVDRLLSSGIIFAKHLGGLSQEELFEAVGRMGGSEQMMASTFGGLVRAGNTVDGCVIDGEPAGYGFTGPEAGYGIFRSSRGAAGTVLGVLGVNDVFWGRNPSWFGEDQPVEPPIFSKDDAIHASTNQYGLAGVVKTKRHFEGFDPDLLADILYQIKPSPKGALLEGASGLSFEKLVEAFGLAEVDDPGIYVQRLLEAGHNDIVWDYYRNFVKQPIAALDIFRTNIDKTSYEFTSAIENGQLTDEHVALGVTRTGRHGLEQLKGLMCDIQAFISSSSKIPEDLRTERLRIQDSKLYEGLWRAAVRFDQAVWGSTASDEIGRILHFYERALEAPENAPAPLVNEVYHPSELVKVAQRQSNKEGMSSAAKDVIDKFGDVAQFGWEDSAAYAHRVDELHRGVQATYAGLRQKLSSETNPDVTNVLQKKLMTYEAIIGGEYKNILVDNGDGAGFLEAYDQLGHIKSMRSVLREKAIRDARNALGDQLARAYRNLIVADSAAVELAAAIEVIDHLLVQEFLLKLRPEDPGYAEYIRKELFNTSIIGQESERLNAGTVDSRTKTLQFTPNRDVGLELSGQIGDACWASKYGSIAEQMPNMIGVLISEHVGEQQRLVGSGLFIEATTGDGEQVLIVRGLNPIENLINKLDQDAFLSKYLEFARETANRAGRKLAIVYDHSSGASTNRPALFYAMTRLKESGRLSPVSVPEDQVAFNNYSLEDSVYLVA